MSQRIACFTLFNVTETGVLNRSRPKTDNVDDWIEKRNTQCNYDTILQVISLRSQPEVIQKPIILPATVPIINRFGYYYNLTENDFYYTFVFEVQHSSVFDNGIQEYGALYNDCANVPMLLCKNQHAKLLGMLDVTDELRNIYFEEA